MKALLNKITGKTSQKAGQTTTPTQAKDAQWSFIRRLTDRVESLELAASTARRDISRISKAQYREKDKGEPSIEKEPAGNGGGVYNPALWG